jgi:DnaJ-class molecular chaperone
VEIDGVPYEGCPMCGGCGYVVDDEPCLVCRGVGVIFAADEDEDEE